MATPLSLRGGFIISVGRDLSRNADRFLPELARGGLVKNQKLIWLHALAIDRARLLERD